MESWTVHSSLRHAVERRLSEPMFHAKCVLSALAREGGWGAPVNGDFHWLGSGAPTWISVSLTVGDEDCTTSKVAICLGVREPE
jgi:hypothetical protein